MIYYLLVVMMLVLTNCQPHKYSAKNVPLQQVKQQLDVAQIKNHSYLAQMGVSMLHENEKVSFILPTDTFFDNETDELTHFALEPLIYLTEIIHDADVKNITIDGHTDDIGSEQFKLKLSEKRALRVASFFWQHKIRSKIKVHGYGDTKPITNNNVEASPENRRIEIIIG